MSREFISCLYKQINNGARKVIIKDEETVVKKLDQLFSKGASALEVVSDFDWTMTKWTHNGKAVPCTHAVLKSDPELSQATLLKLNELDKIYFPIELNPYMTEEEKTPHMVEWWEKVHNALIQEVIHEQALRRSVQLCGIVPRDGMKTFAHRLHAANVPLQVFSAGVGNIIQELLIEFDINLPNISLVSNFMEFNEEGTLVAFRDPLIHCFNKSWNFAHHTRLENDLSMRSNVLLLGDSTGDVRMVKEESADGLHMRPNVLRVGFFNHEETNHGLAKYEELYDIVLVQDDTFDLPNLILDYVLVNPQ